MSEIIRNIFLCINGGLSLYEFVWKHVIPCLSSMSLMLEIQGRLSSLRFHAMKCAFTCFDLIRSQFCIAALIA